MQTVRDRVIENLRDFDRAKPAYSVPEYDRAIIGAYQLLASRMPWPHAHTDSGLTLGPNSDSFTLTTNLGSDVRIRLRRTGEFLTKLTVEELDAFREGQPSATLAPSVPQFYALWIDRGSAGTDLKGRCWPPALASEACDIFTSRIPAELVGPALDAQNVLFDISALEALILETSASLLGRMTPDQAAKLMVNPQIASKWMRDSEILLYRAAATHEDIESVGRTMRWVY